MFSRGNGRIKDGKKVRDRNDAVIVTRDFLKLWLGGMFVCPVDTQIRYAVVICLSFHICELYCMQDQQAIHFLKRNSLN
jgi:hypothetical protein